MGRFETSAYSRTIAAVLFIPLLFALSTPRLFAASVWTETTDTDFADGVFNMTMTSGTGTAAQLTLSPFGTGADGSVTISATKNINSDIISSGRVTYADGINYAVSGVWTSSITCSAAPNGIVTGDEIILINQQGDATNNGNVGNYEFFRIASVSGNFLIFTSSITKIYGATTNNNVLTGQKITAQRVPNWGNVTISGAGTQLTCAAWDGTKGGMVVFRSTGTVSVGAGASVDVSSCGFRGGVAGSNGAEDARNPNITTGGANGSGVNGGGPAGTGAGTGGNGGACNNGPVAPAGTGGRGGGGGGANTVAGGGGGARPHDAGSNYSTISNITMGGGAACGGGAGSGGGSVILGNPGFANGTGGSYQSGGGAGGSGGSGNRGGGIILIYAYQISGSGVISANGGMGGAGGGGGGGREQNGNVHAGAGGGGGGGNGGAGGSIIVFYQNNTFSGTSAVASGTGGGAGGGGGAGTGDNVSSGGGGGGGAGSNGGGGGGGQNATGDGGAGGNAGWAGYNSADGTGLGGAAGGGGGSSGAGGAANNGGYGAVASGANASGINGGAGGNGTYGGGGGGGGKGATGTSGYNSIASAGTIYYSPATYRSNVFDTASKTVVSSISWNPASQPAGTNLVVGIRVSSWTFSANSSTPTWLNISNGQTLNWHGRYIQYQSTFTTTNSTTTPRLEDISVTYRVKPWQEKSITRTSSNAFGFGGGEIWAWEVPVKSGSALTITAYIRYNSEYGGSTTKPKLTLTGRGITPTSISATGAAQDAWELLTINPGTPSQNATLTLRAEGFSTNPGAKFYIDDINVSQ